MRVHYRQVSKVITKRLENCCSSSEVFRSSQSSPETSQKTYEIRRKISKLTIKNCDKIEKFKTILVKSLKMRRRFDVRLTSLSSQ